MNPFLGELGIEPETRKERKDIDLPIRAIVGKSSKDRCNEVWKEVKVWLQDDGKKKILANKLKNQIN